MTAIYINEWPHKKKKGDHRTALTLLWAINRLRAMGPAEIAHRIVEKGKRTLARGRLEGWERYESFGKVPVLPGLQDDISRSADAVWCAGQTQRILDGAFAALGVAWPRRSPDDLFPADLWRLDPITGKHWPGTDTYCFDITYRHEHRLGDIKYVWELNRLQFLQPLAVLVHLTGDGQALTAIEAAVSSWYSANPPFRGVGWISGIELALRAISLLVVTSLCEKCLSDVIIAKIRAILQAHALWISRYPSQFSSANNHLIAEAAGEFLIALAMPELPFASRLESKSRLLLTEEVDKQFHPDGVPAEQSLTYGAFSAELLLLCCRVAEAAGKPLPLSIMARLNAFAEFIGCMTDINGHVPAIGDDDEGRVLTFSPQGPSYVASVCSAIAHSTELEAHQGIKIFPEGGYTVIRERRNGHDLHIVFDHGPLGYLSIAAHGHADALSIIVTIDGKPLFVDPGTYLYHSGGVWRDWFRGTRAHNTLNINGANQSIITGPFIWSHKAKATLEHTHGGKNWWVSAWHDGYQKRFGVRHRRTVYATEDGFAVCDRLEGVRNRQAEIGFQLAVDYDARFEGDKVVIERNGQDVVVLSFDTTGDVTLKKGGEIGQGGWLSPSFGTKIPAIRIAWRGKMPAGGVTSVVTLI